MDTATFVVGNITVDDGAYVRFFGLLGREMMIRAWQSLPLQDYPTDVGFDQVIFAGGLETQHIAGR